MADYELLFGHVLIVPSVFVVITGVWTCTCESHGGDGATVIRGGLGAEAYEQFGRSSNPQSCFLGENIYRRVSHWPSKYVMATSKGVLSCVEPDMIRDSTTLPCSVWATLASSCTCAM